MIAKTGEVGDIMLIRTKHFGEMDLDENRIIYFENGILGFEDYKRYTLLYDNDGNEKPDISWLQSLEDPALAIPVISPFIVKPDYNPEVEDELLKPLGQVDENNIVLLVSITVTSEIEKTSSNLKAPFIINADTKKGTQIIVENQEYEIRYPIYQKLKEAKTKKGDNEC